MILTQLRAVNNQGSTLNLPLEDTSGGYLVKDIEGLGPAKATLISSGSAEADGEDYHTSRLEPRNIVVKLGLTPNYAISSAYELRSHLYSFFMPQSEVLLKIDLFDKFSDSFVDQHLNLEIVGRVESIEVEKFVKDPGVDISIMCYKPALVAPEPVIFNGETVTDLTEVDVGYKGSSSTGVLFSIFPNRMLDEFIIYHRPDNQKLYSTHFMGQLHAGDVLTINSVRGDRFVRRLRGGFETSRLYELSPQANWLTLNRGLNHIRVYASGPPVPFSIEYQTKYGGV